MSEQQKPAARLAKPMLLLLLFIAAVFIFMAVANGIQTNHGSVAVSTGEIATDWGDVIYKLYVPNTATADKPAPAVLLLHGYQNDRETNGAYAIELARRGAVVMSIDEYGHGATQIGMINRGYVNHKVTVNYGEDSELDGTYVEISGPMRYRVMMNFSNLTFFDDHYSKDADGNAILDSSMGGIAAYAALSEMGCVDATRMAVSGHSMGTWASWTVSAAYAGAKNEAGEDISPKATVLQCGELFTNDVYDSEKISFNNILLLQAQYDEFSYFRDYQNVVSPALMETPLRLNFLGCNEAAADWNRTYGSFSDGSARRIALLNTNHRLTTHNQQGMAESLDWFTQAIGLDTQLPSDNQVFMTKEVCVLLAALCAIAAMLPFMELLLATPFFGCIRGKVPNRPEKARTGGKWAKGALITILIAGLSYPFMTQLGHGLLPLPEGVFRMTIGNGFLSWYLLLIVVMLITTVLSRKKAAKQGNALDYYDIGLAREEKANRLDWALCGKSALLAILMVGLMYALVSLCQSIFLLDFRFIWPFFKTFTGERFLQFLVYIPIFALFFLLNNSKIFAQMRVPEASKPGFAGFLGCWWKYALCMVGGILLMILVEYIPFFMGIGPGADLLFGSTFGGPFMSLLIVFAPQVLIFSVLCTYIYRKTGSVYVGAFTVASLACWIVTGGSAIL